jgi:hypothetical protein
MPDNYDDLFHEVNDTAEQLAEPQNAQLSKEEFAAKKQAERESLSELDYKTERTFTAVGGAVAKYLITLARFERYSAQNTLLIHAQRPDATCQPGSGRLGDYDHWKEAGTPVSKGAIGIAIFEPGKEYTREDGSIGVSMNIKKVFDISQTAARGKLPPEPKRDTRVLLKALMESRPCPIKLVDKLTQDGYGGQPPYQGAHYSEQRDVIEVERGLDGESLFRCLAQEIAYATLDHQNTDTLLCNDKGFAAYAASYALCAKHGVEAKGYDFNEVKQYFAGREGKDIRGELKTIRDTVNDVATRMARSLNPPEKQAKNQEARS